MHSVGPEANAGIDVDEIDDLAFLVDEPVEDVKVKVNQFESKCPTLYAKGTGDSSLALRTKMAGYCPLRSPPSDEAPGPAPTAVVAAGPAAAAPVVSAPPY